MPSENVQLTGLEASADMSGDQYKAVKLTTTGVIAVVNSTLDRSIGILQNDPNTGEAADVIAAGESKAVAGGAITVADALTANKTGQMETTAVNGRPIVGIALQDAGAAGDIIDILVTPSRY